MDELTPETCHSMVSHLEPSWSVTVVERAAEGTDLVYYVSLETPEGPREAVLKACSFVEPDAFRPEPVVLELLHRETTIPVPRVYGRVDDHETLPAPYFLMERLPGAVREDGSRDLPLSVLERIARDGGRHLAELHTVGSFDRFGVIHCSPSGLSADRPRVAALEVGPTGHESWQAALSAQLEEWSADVHERFEGLASPLQSFLRDRLECVTEPTRPVFGNTDYRLGNLLIDPASGKTNAVIDWGNCHTTEPVYNLAALEENLSGYARLDDPRRRRVRRAIDAGYRERATALGRELPPTIQDRLFDDGGLTRLGECYYGTLRLAPMVWFSLWNADESQRARDRTASRHRAVVEGLLERR